jgi:hypothetical protein
VRLPWVFAVYTTFWLAAGVLAAGLCVRRRAEFSLFTRDYWRFLLVPWKVVTFAIALIGMVWLGPRSGDPTWDPVDATFMCALTYLSAPWAVGTLVRAGRGWTGFWQGYLAAWLWLFSASWCYDLYILLRDGSYPPSWLANLGASSVLYALAGLLWNIEWAPVRGTSLGFLHERWPERSVGRASPRVLVAALPIVLLVTALMLGFFLHSR